MRSRLLYGEDAPVWSIPLLAAAVLILCELVSLSRGPAPDAAVERPAVTAVLVGRLLVAALLAFAGATVALLAAAVPARHGLATGLLGAAAAAALFLLVAAVARRGGEAQTLMLDDLIFKNLLWFKLKITPFL